MEFTKPNTSKTKSYTIKDFYQYYIENLEDGYDAYAIDYKTYRAMIEEYFKWIRDRLIEQGRTIKLPYRMGTLAIIKKKMKFGKKTSMPIDFRTSRETGKLTFFFNEHSNYYKYRFKWNKDSMLIKNRDCYQLVMTRANKRRLAQIIKNRERDYIGSYR